jgi:hypothetical protein
MYIYIQIFVLFPPYYPYCCRFDLATLPGDGHIPTDTVLMKPCTQMQLAGKGWCQPVSWASLRATEVPCRN